MHQQLHILIFITLHLLELKLLQYFLCIKYFNKRQNRIITVCLLFIYLVLATGLEPKGNSFAPHGGIRFNN